eukprot:UN05742
MASLLHFYLVLVVITIIIAISRAQLVTLPSHIVSKVSHSFRFVSINTFIFVVITIWYSIKFGYPVQTDGIDHRNNNKQNSMVNNYQSAFIVPVLFNFFSLRSLESKDIIIMVNC